MIHFMVPYNNDTCELSRLVSVREVSPPIFCKFAITLTNASQVI